MGASGWSPPTGGHRTEAPPLAFHSAPRAGAATALAGWEVVQRNVVQAEPLVPDPARCGALADSAGLLEGEMWLTPWDIVKASNLEAAWILARRDRGLGLRACRRGVVVVEEVHHARLVTGAGWQRKASASLRRGAFAFTARARLSAPPAA